MKVESESQSQYGIEGSDVFLTFNGLDQKPSLAKKHGIRKGPSRPTRKSQPFKASTITPKTENGQRDPEHQRTLANNAAKGRNLACDKCDEVFKYNIDLVHHKYRSHNMTSRRRSEKFEPVPLPIPIKTGAKAKNVPTIRRPITVETTEYPPCEECGENFNDSIDMIYHKGHAHPKTPKADKAQEYPSKSKPDATTTPCLQRFGASVRKVFPCKDCDVVFVLPTHLSSHLVGKSHQSKIKKKIAAAVDKISTECKLCEMKFNTLSTLAEHKMELHDKYGPFMCFGCNERFSSLLEMKTHERTCSIYKSAFYMNPDPIDEFWGIYTTKF